MPFYRSPYLRLMAWAIAVLALLEGLLVIVDPAYIEKGPSFIIFRHMGLPRIGIGVLLIALSTMLVATLICNNALAASAVMSWIGFIQGAWALGFFLAAVEYGDGGWFSACWLLFIAVQVSLVSAHTYKLIRSK